MMQKVLEIRPTCKTMGAMARIHGGPLAPQISGTAFFIDVPGGTEIHVEVRGLPAFQQGLGNKPQVGPHGFHIHEYGSCQVGDPKNPFQAAGGHWNPYNQPHGNHAGDFPVLFSNRGRASMTFFTDKFRVKDVIGKTVIIHESPDDYRTQPAGNSGKRLACGVVQSVSSMGLKRLYAYFSRIIKKALCPPGKGN